MSRSEDDFRKSIHRVVLAEFLASAAGQALLSFLLEFNRPTPVDDNAPVTAHVAAHAKSVGRNEITEKIFQLSLPPEQPPEEEKATFGTPLEELPDEMK